MRVLFITSAYPTHPDDARGIFIHRLARELCQHATQVTVIAPGAPSASSSETMDGVEVYRATYWVPRWQCLATDLSGIVPALRQYPWLVAQVPPVIIALTWHALRLSKSFDLIHAHWLYPAGIAGVVAAKHHRLPLVITSHGGDLNLAKHSRVLQLMCKRISHASDACIGVSRSLCEQFRASGIAEDRSVYFPVGAHVANISSSYPGDCDKAFWNFKSFDGLRVIFVGSLTPRKSVETLLEAHHKLEARGLSVASAIVGPGSLRDGLKSMAREALMKNVFIVGEQPPSLIPMWISAAHVLVLPSLSEGQPTVVMEAMALGLPVIATDIAGTRELVRDGGTGFLFPPRDAEKLAKCIEEFIKNESLRQQMGQRAQEYITSNGLTTPQIAQKHISLYERVIGLRKRPSNLQENP